MRVTTDRGLREITEMGPRKIEVAGGQRHHVSIGITEQYTHEQDPHGVPHAAYFPCRY